MLRSSIWTALTSALIISLGQASHIRVCAEDPTDNCLKPLEDVTIVAPAKGFVVAKVECLGCPAGLSGGDHEDNALVIKFSLIHANFGENKTNNTSVPQPHTLPLQEDSPSKLPPHLPAPQYPSTTDLRPSNPPQLLSRQASLFHRLHKTTLEPIDRA
jgi:hypothetical protein